MDIKDCAPWAPPDYDLGDASALKGLMNGTANAAQQQRALKWILEQGCGTYDLSYRPTSDRDTAFAEGRRFVGLQIVKLLHLDTSLMRKE